MSTDITKTFTDNHSIIYSDETCNFFSFWNQKYAFPLNKPTDHDVLY